MPANKHFRDLSQHVLAVSSSKKELSGVEIHEKVRRYYPLAQNPSRMTVHRTIQELIKQGEMYEGDAGYLKKEDAAKYSIEPFMSSHPNDELKNEIAVLLMLGALDPVDNASRIKEVVDERLLPLVARMRTIIELLDLISQSPEIVLWMAHNHKLIQENIKDRNEGVPLWEEMLWKQIDTYGEYAITCYQKETP